MVQSRNQQEKSKRSRFLLSTSLAALGFAAALAASSPASAADPIKFGVIAEAQSVSGGSIPLAAQLAADEINAKGGVDGRKIEIVVYDNHSSAAESVRAFQRAVNEDKVHAVIASYTSEVVLALEPLGGASQDGDDHARCRLRCYYREHRERLRNQQIHLPRVSDLDLACRARMRCGQRTCWSTGSR